MIMDVGLLLKNLIVAPVKVLLEMTVSGTDRFFPGNLLVIVSVLALMESLLAAPLYVYARRIWRKEKRVSSVEASDRKANAFLRKLVQLWPFFLEIPVVAALRWLLSDLELFNVPMGALSSLNKPDALLSLGEARINVVPVAAAVLFCLAGLVSVRHAPPAIKGGVVLVAIGFGAYFYSLPVIVSLPWGAGRLICLGENLLFARDRKRKRWLKNAPWLRRKPNAISFLISCGLFSVLLGLLIPSSVIVASPADFVKNTASLNPLWYIAGAFLMAAGTSFLWFGALYYISRRRTKKVLEVLAWVICGIMLINYLFFRKGLGIISARLQYETEPTFTMQQRAINLLVLSVAAIVLAFLMIREELMIRVISIALIVALGGMTMRNVFISYTGIQEAYRQMEKNEESRFHIPISKTGKNVIVLMLDRAVGVFLQAIMKEKPELMEKYSGFTYYPNTISHGQYTNFGTPGLFGGYEYTPAEMNKRDQEPLSEKHNEALKMMPTLFSQNGYLATVCNPSYAGYQEKPDLTIYDDLPGVSAYVTEGLFLTAAAVNAEQEAGFRNYYCFALSETVPLAFSRLIYDLGNYHQLSVSQDTQVRRNASVASGISEGFMDEYIVLQHLTDLTEVSDDPQDTFLMMVNKITHNPMLLQEPEYIPVEKVDNRAYDSTHKERFKDLRYPITVKQTKQMSHYHVLMAAMIQIGEWLDELRAQDVYNNTRIIIVADHGRGMEMPNMQLEDGKDILNFNPLLMVKDFDAVGALVMDDTFMTNADVPTIATKNVIEDPINPYTGLRIDGDTNKKDVQFITASRNWRVSNNKGNTLSPADWYTVHDNMFDLSNWEYIGQQ